MAGVQASVYTVLVEALGAHAVLSFLRSDEGRRYCYRLRPEVLSDPKSRANAVSEIRAMAAYQERHGVA